MAEVITPKRQAVVDRLRRRIENYRNHQRDCIPRFNQSFNGLVEQNVQDTLALKQRYLENKSKRAAKKTEKKIPDNPLQGLHSVTQFLPKRAADDHDGYGHGDGPPPKQQNKSSPAEPLTKFSVEIVQQLEFTTSAGNNSQISTNVTVKALNTSVKSDLTTTTVSPQPQPPTPTTVECKREHEDNPEFVDLEQCAAALEKDAAANGGNSFPGFSDLIGDETSDAIITSDAFKDLISEISDFHPAFLKDLDFGGGDTKHNILSGDNQMHNNHHQHQQHQQQVHHQQQQQLQHVFKTEEDSKSNILGSHQQQQQRASMQQQQRMYSSGMDFVKTELSPAAHTLKQMAEQHQHKTQLGINFNPANKPYSEFQYGNSDYLGSPQNNNVNSQQYKPMVSQSPKSNYVSSDNIKQEVFSAQNSPGVYSPGSGKGNQTPTGQPRLNTGFKQQYSPYGSPGAGAHGSPQYTPRAPSQGPPPQAPPPRPPSCPSSTTLQINQAQQLHISQAHGQPIQVSMAQSQNLCADMKGSTAVSIASQQGLYTSSESLSYCSVSQSQSISLTQRHRAAQEKMMHPQEKMMQQQQEKMMHQQQQEKMMQQQQEKMMQQQQEKMMQQQQEKMMQQQQEKMMHQHQEKMMQQQQEKMIQQQQEKMMHQQEKMMHPQLIRIPQQQVRPPPPEYKVSQHHPSMVQHQNFLPQQRISQQPLPPSGPMMRPGAGGGVVGGGGYLVSSSGARMQYTRPQRPLHSGGPEWRHMLQQHQPQRPTFHQAQGVMFSSGDMQMGAGQMQQVSHLTAAQHQSLAMQHSSPQMSVNLQMQQSMAGVRQHHHPHPHPPTSQMSFSSPATSQYNTPYPSLAPTNLDNFNLDFLDHDQDLLSSLEAGAPFNIHDIL